LFDLDDTLYPQSAGIMNAIGARMNEYMIARVGIAPDEVARLRQEYWEKFGTTLRGLYLEHAIDPQDFLQYVHDIPVESFITRDERLDALFTALPQTKSIFTNAPEDYARRVLAALGIEKHFARVFGINFIRYESKPNPAAYTIVLDALGARGDECALIDDTARNLAPARALGMKTIWLRGEKNRADGFRADAEIDSIYALAQVEL
ncbi:MAG: pyrimidine 5'-nucleotidase, partial [Chloroflexi bacterium]|nr:pyrimidine 5'-nucleotidase [Chloroflexota bacterium]